MDNQKPQENDQERAPLHPVVMPHVLSLGAGVQSSTLALMAATGELSPMPIAAIFADTQSERSNSKTNMSRWYRTGEEQQGYDDRKEADRWASYPYERNHDYREGWDDAARDERRAQERREEERMEQEAAERAEERRQHEAAQMRRAEEEQFYEQQHEPTPEPPVSESPNAPREPRGENNPNL